MTKIFKTMSLIAVLSLLTISVFAQGRGILRGQVRDENGGILPGAAVYVKGTTLGASTDINGAYMIQGVPAGENEVVVDYLGYDTVTKTVTINAGTTVNQDFTLTELSHTIERVTVTAMIDGQQRSLNQQKVAPNMMQVLSADQIGLFPDLNVADALKRVSGVTSDGSTVSLRGTPANFTSININGEQIVGTSEGGVRSPSLDFIPSDVLATMEIQKTLMPSNDGDAIGGVINLRSSEARSLKPRVTLDMGPGYNFLREKMSVNAKGSYEQRFGSKGRNPNGAFGVSAKYSYYNSHTGYDRIEANNWISSALARNNGDPKTSGKETWVPSDFRYRYQSLETTRHGASLVLDWAPSLNTKFVLMGGYNSLTSDGERWRNRFRFRSSAAYWGMYCMEDSDFPAATYENLPEDGFGIGARGADRLQNISQYTKSDEKTDNYNINFNWETVFGNWKLDGSVSYSASKTKYESFMPGFQTADYRGNNKDINGTGSPAFKIPKNQVVGYIPDIHTKYLTMEYLMKATGQTAGLALDDPSRYYLYIIENWNHTTEGENFTAQLNSSFNHFLGKNASTLSFGVKGKFIGNNGFVPEGGSSTYKYSFPKNALPDPSLALSNLLYRSELSSNFMDGHLNFGPAADGNKVREGMKNNNFNGQMKLDDNTSNQTADAYYFDAKERVLAAYAMEKIQFKNLMILAGIRYEHNSMDYKANSIFRYDKDVDLNVYPSGQNPANLPANGGDGAVYTAYQKTQRDSTINYHMFLPNIQAKYELGRSTVFRLAWTTGYARPNTMDIVPKSDINEGAGVITVGNPNLKPAYAHNIDLLAEHYLPNVGLLSGGFFYKNINKFQYLSQMPLDGSSQYFYDDSPFTLMRKHMNGKTASVYGFEATLNSALTFMPGFLRNLVFTGNYTYVHSRAEVDRIPSDQDGPGTEILKEKIRLPGQASHTANIALAYSSKRFSVQAAYNYIGSYIMSLGGSKEQDVWLEGRWQLDLNASVNIIKGLSFWAEAQNVLNAEKYQYFGEKNRLYQMQFNGASARCGFTYKF